MSTFLASVTVIVIIGVIGAILCWVFRHTPIPPVPPVPNPSPSDVFVENCDVGESPDSCPTMLINQVILQILNSDGSIKDEIPLPRIPSSGLSLGKAQNDKVRISEGVVSRHHCDLGEDDKGMFIIDNNSTNGLYTSKDLKHRVKQINVVFGEVYYIANIPIKFKTTNTMEAVLDITAKTQKYFGNREVKSGVLYRVE